MDTPLSLEQSIIVRFANHNGVMRAQRLVQRSAPQGLELVVVQGAFLDVQFGKPRSEAVLV